MRTLLESVLAQIADLEDELNIIAAERTLDSNREEKLVAMRETLVQLKAKANAIR